jgi:hypothetical protein
MFFGVFHKKFTVFKQDKGITYWLFMDQDNRLFTDKDMVRYSFIDIGYVKSNKYQIYTL